MSDTVALNVNADLGPLILGGLFAFGLSGCVNMQFVVYWQIYSRERWTTKSLVTAIWLLDLCHSAFAAVAIWESVITPYGDLNKANVIPWSISLTIELTAILTFVVQSFFAHRIYRLQNRRIMIAGLAFTLALARLATGSAAVAGMIRSKKYTAFVHSSPPVFVLATLGLSFSALDDILIAAFLCYFLRSNRTQIPRSSTNHIIDTLTLWTVQTGSITCLGAVASLVSLVAMPQNRIFIGLHFVVGKLYANSLLATLNARSTIRRPLKQNTTTPLVPIPVFPSDAFKDRDEENGRTSAPGIQSPYPFLSVPTQKCVDSFGHQSMNPNRVQSKIEVSVQRTIEARYDDDTDTMSMIAEPASELGQPRVV